MRLTFTLSPHPGEHLRCSVQGTAKPKIECKVLLRAPNQVSKELDKNIEHFFAENNENNYQGF
jgi:hypothetical protein